MDKIIELKAQVFDVLARQEQLQYKINQEEEIKKSLLSQIEIAVKEKRETDAKKEAEELKTKDLKVKAEVVIDPELIEQEPVKLEKIDKEVAKALSKKKKKVE